MTSSYRLCTTFPEWAWGEYAQRAIESFDEFWPGSIVAYYEGSPPPSTGAVEFRPLNEIEDLQTYLESVAGLEEPDFYMQGFKKFSNKVFVQLETLKEADQVIWLDADVVLYADAPDIPLPAHVCFLGRKNIYTETGLVGFNKDYLEFEEFEQRYRDCYLKHKILSFTDGQTDCHAFDWARQGLGHSWVTGTGFGNIFSKGPLGGVAFHFKGNRKEYIEEEDLDAVRAAL